MPVPHFDAIETERLSIRPMVAGDVGALFTRRNDPTTAEFQNWTLPYARERAQHLVDEMLAHDGVPPGNGWFQLAVDDRIDGSPLGDLAIRLSFDGRCAEIGFTVDARVRGRGIATEAAAAVVAWLFESVEVTRVSAMMHPENLASVRVAEQIGMVFEGHTRNSYWVGNENSDDWIYGSTVESWRAWRDRPRSRPATVELVAVTAENRIDVCTLATHHSQQRFVTPIAGTFADAYVALADPGSRIVPWLRAIAADGVIVGAVLVREPTAGQPSAYLWRLLIDRMHQRRGIGSRAVALVIDHATSLGAPAVDLSYLEGPGSPGPLYHGHGFVPTGMFHDGETMARLEL